jgi:hypothetical protein
MAGSLDEVFAWMDWVIEVRCFGSVSALCLSKKIVHELMALCALLQIVHYFRSTKRLLLLTYNVLFRSLADLELISPFPHGEDEASRIWLG